MSKIIPLKDIQLTTLRMFTLKRGTDLLPSVWCAALSNIFVLFGKFSGYLVNRLFGSQ